MSEKRAIGDRRVREIWRGAGWGLAAAVVSKRNNGEYWINLSERHSYIGCFEAVAIDKQVDECLSLAIERQEC